MQQHLIDYIRQPETLDVQAVARLESITNEHPYFHAARILMLEGMYKLHSPKFDEQLRKQAILTPDRQALFHLIEEPNYLNPEQRKKYVEDEIEDKTSSRTANLIDDFLSNQPQEMQPRTKAPINATQDYIGYMLQNEENATQTADVPFNGGGVIEGFLQEEPKRIILKSQPENEETYSKTEEAEEAKEDAKNAVNDGKSEILTEIMAGIYIKQGKFESAIKIIQQLSLKYPEKNRYFADQIRFMEKLIINNNNK